MSEEDIQTAMLLTQQEWEDLVVICKLFLAVPDPVNASDRVKHRNALCDRIIKAAS
jgi:hypothetical protein